ncbi:zinc finger protein 740 isoform 3-T3 [Trichechus inunguis]
MDYEFRFDLYLKGHRKDSDKSRSRKDDDSLAEASHSKKTVKKVRSHLSVIYVICASSRSITWSATSVYTVAKSLTSVNGVISVFLGQIDYSDTNGCAKGASPRLPMGSFLYRCKGPQVVGMIRRIYRRAHPLWSMVPPPPHLYLPPPGRVDPGDQKSTSGDSSLKASVL